MGFYLSPLVDINEVDLSTTVPAVATSIAVEILRGTYKGPERKKTLITNIDQLINKFGEPTDIAACYQDILSAIGYLRYGNMLYCTRTMPTSATFAGTKAASGGEATFVPFTSSGAYILSDFSNEDPDDFADYVTWAGNEPMQFIANSRGVWGNKIRIIVVSKEDYDDINEGSNSTWDTYEAISDVDSPLDSDEEFLVIVQICPQSSDSSDENSWNVEEVWNVSTNENKMNDQGENIFCETTINQQSNYIRMAIASAFKNTDNTMTNDEFQTFGGGADDNGDAITDALVEDDLDLYKNPEEIDVNIFIDSNKSTEVKQYISTICKTERKDSIGLLDCERSDVINNTGSEATSLRTSILSLNENTSYCAFYGNWLEIYDRWNNKYRWIPASGYAAGIVANTDDLTDPWFAPAGLNRAILMNVRKLAWNPTLGERNILYKNGINPIVSFAGLGKVIWGQKTLLAKNSAFNRLNVRRLFLVLEKAISTACKYFLFEPNDDMTRMLLFDMIEPFLRDVKARRGIYEYRIVCDDANNTPERIDRNELWVDIYVKPTKTAEFIVLNFIATKTGASFSEIAVAAA